MSDVFDLIIREIWSDLDENWRFDVRFEIVTSRDDAFEEFGEHSFSLEVSEAGSIGRGDVHDEDIGIRTERVDTLDEIIDRVWVADLVLAKVDSEHFAISHRTWEAEIVDRSSGLTSGGREEGSDGVVVIGEGERVGGRSREEFGRENRCVAGEEALNA